MKTQHFVAKLRSISPYGQGAAIKTPRERNEDYDAHDNRTWRERMHVTNDGFVFIPPMAFFHSLCTACQRLGMKIPGRRGATYTKAFESGLLIHEPVVLGIKAAEVQAERLFVPADGKPGGGTRVWKSFPRIDSWEGILSMYSLNQAITEPVLLEHLEAAGMLCGVGVFRPQNRGYWGRFEVVEFGESKE